MNKKLNWKQFIDFWKQHYNPRHYPDEEYYLPYIKPNGALNKKDLKKLFEWKNGMPLSENKKKVLNSAINSLDKINNFRKLKRISVRETKKIFDFVSKIVKSGIVWRIFLLHLIKPRELPMIDRFTFTAIRFLRTWKIIKFQGKYQNLKEYLKFRENFNKITKKSELNYREVDKALMAFGKFLNNPRKFLKNCSRE